MVVFCKNQEEKKKKKKKRKRKEKKKVQFVPEKEEKHCKVFISCGAEDPLTAGRSEPNRAVIWLKMSVGSENSCFLLSAQDSRTSCVFQAADEKDEISGVGEDSVLEMLSYSKFSDLETWLCMPSSLLLSRALDSTLKSSSSSSLSSSQASILSSNSLPVSSSSSLSSNHRHSTCSEPGELRSSVGESFLTPALEKEMTFLSTPLLPILSSTPTAASAAGGSAPHRSIRKRRRLAASPGGLHWTPAVESETARELWT